MAGYARAVQALCQEVNALVLQGCVCEVGRGRSVAAACSRGCWWGACTQWRQQERCARALRRQQLQGWQQQGQAAQRRQAASECWALLVAAPAVPLTHTPSRRSVQEEDFVCHATGLPLEEPAEAAEKLLAALSAAMDAQDSRAGAAGAKGVSGRTLRSCDGLGGRDLMV